MLFETLQNRYGKEIASRFKQTGQAGPRLDQEQEEVTKSMCGHVLADVKSVCACEGVWNRNARNRQRNRSARVGGLTENCYRELGGLGGPNPYTMSLCVALQGIVPRVPF